MQITVKRLVVLPVFAAVLLSGCSSTLHPTITVTPQNGGSSFTITGKGFSSGSPCATLSYDPPSGVATIKADVPCAGGQFTSIVNWTPAQIPGCTANTPAAVIAVDHKTGTPAAATVSLLCEAALCPDSFTEASLPTSMPNYFTSGHSVSGGTYSAGSTGLANVWTLSTCVSGFTFERKSNEQVTGGFEKCTYDVVKASSSSCNSVKNAQKLTLVFTCPDSGACR